ncbi:MAG: methyltransferase domain-containing protein [Rickettsiales bacterium]|nr:MAG: methyltransferase domain-containing protein [Rickettsiales bacterium]
MNNIFVKMKNTIKKIFSGIIYLPKKIYTLVDQIINDCITLRIKMKDLAKSNIDVGQYHLRNGNYNDAIFRFKLVDKFLDKNNIIANYYLGLAYFFKKDYQNATTHLLKAEKKDKIGLLNFIKNIDNIESVPDKIYKLHRKNRAQFFVDKFASEENNIPQNLIIEFNKAASDLPAQYSILEIGSNIGLLGFEIAKRMQDEFIITATEISREMINIQSVIYPDQQFYDEIYNDSAEAFIENNLQNFDVIFSLDGFSYIKNLRTILANIFSKLNNNGYFAFCVRTSNNPSFSYELLEFSYNFEQLSADLREIGFKILSYKNFNLENKNNYTILICTKQI